MKCFSTIGVLILLALGLIGCSSPASQSSPESVRDPLGVERSVNDYYFRNGAPAPTGDLNGDSSLSLDASGNGSESGVKDDGS